jgi:hypothetical protein
MLCCLTLEAFRLAGSGSCFGMSWRDSQKDMNSIRLLWRSSHKARYTSNDLPSEVNCYVLCKTGPIITSHHPKWAIHKPDDTIEGGLC